MLCSNRKTALAGRLGRDYLLGMREKLNVRLPGDEGPNPYDSKTDPKDYPPKDWQIAGRGAGWWFAIITMGLIWGFASWMKTKT
jgi:hypothetical protein